MVRGPIYADFRQFGIEIHRARTVRQRQIRQHMQRQQNPTAIVVRFAHARKSKADRLPARYRNARERLSDDFLGRLCRAEAFRYPPPLTIVSAAWAVFGTTLKGSIRIANKRRQLRICFPTTTFAPLRLCRVLVAQGLTLKRPILQRF